MSKGSPGLQEAEVGRIFREEFGRSVATLTRVFGDLDVAEDAVQEAFTVALQSWPVDGLPQNPGAWITSTARRRAIDRIRREARGRDLIADLAEGATSHPDPELDDERTVHDDRLRLLFTCCHPALALEAQVALTLRLFGGLSTDEVGRAFLVEEATMAQRLVRAKRKIKAAQIPYRVPEGAELEPRLRPVAAVLYLVYNAGAEHPPGGASRAGDLCFEALRLARVLVELMPDEPEVLGLLALMLLCESRRGARFDESGALVLLRDQDRGAWDGARIEEGHALMRTCLRLARPGPYQLQAAIHAVHADATAFERTDWGQIVALYDQLLAVAPSPVVALNRAIAVGEVDGSAAALALVDELELDSYPALHATRAEVLARLGRGDEARTAFERAAELTSSAAEREHLVSRAREFGAA